MEKGEFAMLGVEYLVGEYLSCYDLQLYILSVCCSHPPLARCHPSSNNNNNNNNNRHRLLLFTSCLQVRDSLIELDY